MSEKKKHPLEVVGYEGDLEQLAKAIFGMRYDRVESFLSSVADELRRQEAGDRGRSRVQLAALLEEAARLTEQQKILFGRIWVLCAPYMKDEYPDR